MADKEPFLKCTPRPGYEVLAAASDLDWEIEQIANGKRKPSKLSLEKLAIVLTFVRAVAPTYRGEPEA